MKTVKAAEGVQRTAVREETRATAMEPVLRSRKHKASNVIVALNRLSEMTPAPGSYELAARLPRALSSISSVLLRAPRGGTHARGRRAQLRRAKSRRWRRPARHPGCGPVVAGRQRGCTEVAGEQRQVGCLATAVGPRDEGTCGGVDATMDVAVAAAELVVARVLVQDRGHHSGGEDALAGSAGDRGSEPLGVAGAGLAVVRCAIDRLRVAGGNKFARKRKRRDRTA